MQELNVQLAVDAIAPWEKLTSSFCGCDVGIVNCLYGYCPLLTVGVEVDLPKTRAGAISADASPLVVSIKSDGSLFLQKQS